MKKYFLLIASLAVLFACDKEKNKEEGGGGPGTKATVVRVGTSTLLFDAVDAPSQTLKVYADGTWTSESPEWITVNPASGSGTVTVTVSVTDNESVDGRIGEVVFAPELTGSTTNKLTVQQKGDNKVTLRTGAQLAEWLSGLTDASLDEARIAADIDMKGITLKSAEGFSGSLDGGGFAIKNLTATGPLFKVNKGRISDVTIDASCSFEPDSNVFGAIAARNEGVIEDCINKANVSRTIQGSTRESNLLAGVVGMSANTEQPVKGCKNYGNISLLVENNGSFTSQGIAGVVAYTIGAVTDCENYGDVSLSGGYHSGRACPARDPNDLDNIEAGEFYNKKVGSSVGGVVAYALAGLSGCKNEGKVSWTESKLEGMSTSPARFFTGGVAGCYFVGASDCTNSGAVVIKVLTSDKSDYTGQNHQHCIGGVFGAVNNPADDSPSKNRGVDVSGCNNTGAITMESYASKSWTHLGGVIGWPASDNDNTNPSNWGKMSSCTNSGSITVSGTAKFRCGGVVGATPYMESCSNTGDITINGTHIDSMVGGIAGRHWGYAQVVRNCTSAANITATVPVDGISGLIGWISCASSAVVEGGSVSGSLTAVSGSSFGMLAGGGGKESGSVTLGSSSAPVEVSGTVNGTSITSSNAADLLFGSSFEKAEHTINYVVK